MLAERVDRWLRLKAADRRGSVAVAKRTVGAGGRWSGEVGHSSHWRRRETLRHLSHSRWSIEGLSRLLSWWRWWHSRAGGTVAKRVGLFVFALLVFLFVVAEAEERECSQRCEAQDDTNGDTSLGTRGHALIAAARSTRRGRCGRCSSCQAVIATDCGRKAVRGLGCRLAQL